MNLKLALDFTYIVSKMLLSNYFFKEISIRVDESGFWCEVFFFNPNPNPNPRFLKIRCRIKDTSQIMLI